MKCQSREPQADGSIILTLPDGTKILFIPSGTLNPELTGNLPQFEHAAGYQSVLVYSGGNYTLTEKDGTSTAFTKIGDAYKPSVLTDRNGGTLSYEYTSSDPDGTGSVTGISGEVLGTSSVTWTWQPPDGAAGYAVYSDTGIFLSSVTAGASFVQSGLAPNSPASVCVAAYNVYGEGARTCSPALYTLANIPGVPETVSVSSYSLTVKWASGGNPAGTLYELNTSTDLQSGSSTSALVGSGVGEVYAAIPALSAATTYYVRVRAINIDSIPSAYSASAATRTFSAPPDAPINPAAAFSAASKKVSLFWSAALLGTPAASFRIYRAAEPSPNSFGVRGATENTWFEDNILYSSTYYYRVTAFNSDGLESDFSQTVSVAADVVAPGSVADLKAFSTDSATGRITLSWTAPSEDWGLDRYIIKAATNTWGDAQWNEAQTLAEVAAAAGPGGRETFVLTLASTDVVRYVALKAVDDFGNQSVMSNLAAADFEPPAIDVTCAVQANSIVGRPFGITIAAQDNYSISRLEYLVDGVAISTSFPQSPYFNASYTWDITDYPDGYHVFSVRVDDYSGNTKQWDLPVTVNYIPPAAPAITNPGVDISISTTTVSISGTAEPGTYVVIFAGDAFMASIDASSGFFGTQITLSGDGVFSITAQAVDKKGASPRSKPISVIVDTGPPGPPQNLSAGSAAGGAVLLLWSLPTGEKPVSYNIYRSTSETALVAGAEPNSVLRVTQNITVLEQADYPPSDGIYYYGATSVDAAGNESFLSNISAAVSDRLAPSASVAISSVPPLGAGSYGVTVTVSETLAYAPYLTFTPYGQFPVQVYLTPESVLVWRGTFTITADMASGAGKFSFGGTDISGNTGGPVTAGRTLELETDGPTASLSLAAVKPALKAGTYAVNLNLNKSAREAPALSYLTQAGSTETVSLSSSTDATAWTGAITILSAIGEGAHNFSYWAYDRLGNKGELLSGTTYFIVDTIPPGKPIALNGLAGAGGVVNLGWSAPAGERPSAYCLYRDAQPVICGIVPDPADFTGFYADTAPEGAHTYAVMALDAAGNESPLSDAVNINSDSTPPAPPVIKSYSSLVELAWEPGSTDTLKYRLYRTTYPLTGVAGLSYRVLYGTSAADSPEADGWYYYALTGLDAAGNESGLSNQAEIQYDGAAPVITISGVENNAYYNSGVIAVISITDLALSASTATINGSAFVSGSTISAEGAYALAVSASDLGGRSSQKTVSFIIDKTSPAVALSGIQDGGYYEQAVVPVISVIDLNLSSVSALLNGSPFVSGSSVSAGGSYELAVLAQDKAGNASTLSISFTVNPPPAKPKNFSLTIEDGKTAVLTWESPAPGMVLYKVYKDNIYTGPAQISDLSFRDTFYSPGTVTIYEVSAIDSKGREGEKTRAEILPVTLALSGYGTYLSDNVAANVNSQKEALNRRFFDSIRFNVKNQSAQNLTVGALSVELQCSSTPLACLNYANPVNISALSSSEISVTVYVSTSLANTVSVKAVLTLPPSIDAVAVSLSKTFTLNVRNPLEPIVETYPEALVRGTYSNVRLKFNNRGSAPLDIVTARLSGSKTVPSKAVAVELKTGAELVLSRAELAQTSGASIAIVGGEQLYFIRIPGGSSYTFEPVRPAVPQEAAEKLIVQGIIGGSSGALDNAPGLAYSIQSGVVYSPGIFVSSKTMATELAIPYKVALYSDKQVYDKETPVKLYGQFQDIWGNLLGGLPLSLTVANKGYERRFDVVTDSSANFSVEFTPGPSEAGIYNISAKHPDFVGEAAYSSFSVVGMEFGWADYTLTMARNSSYTFEAEFTNTGETPLEGLSAAMQNISGFGVMPSTVPFPASIPAGTRQKLAVSFNAETSASETAEFVLKVTDANGFERSLPIHIKTVPAQVISKITPQVFEVGMLAGEIRTQVIMVENIGFSTWTAVRVSTPTLTWARIAGLQNSLGDICPGQNASFTLIFEPSAFLPNGSYAQNPLVTITGGGADPAPVNVGITVTSFRKGSVLFNVTSADIPFSNPTGRLGGADMRLTSLDISGMLFNAKTDSNGLARFEDIPSGKYVYKAELQGYGQVSGVLEIEPGLVKTVNVYMPTTMVTYKWSVTPTTITDKYDITVDMTFRTDVPAPVIVINPPLITLNMEGGQTAYAQYTIKNEGMVSIFDFSIELDNANPAIKIEVPFTKIPEIKPLQTIVVPVKITLIHASCESASIRHKGKYVCASGIWVVVDAADVRIMSGNMCPSAPAVTPYNAGGGWAQPLVFGGGSAANIAAMNKDVVMDMGCGTMCIEGTATGCSPCTICLAGECRPNPLQDGQSCGKASNICQKMVCQTGSCVPVDNSAETNQKVANSEIDMSDCPNRVRKDPNTYNPWDYVNGCGTKDAKIPDNPDLSCDYSFKGPCDTHDACYGTCNNDKLGCDLALMTDAATKVCANITNPICKTTCLEAAAGYSVVASIAAYFNGAYKNAQSDGCKQCCP